MNRTTNHTSFVMIVCGVFVASELQLHADIVYLENGWQVVASDGFGTQVHIPYHPAPGMFAHSDQAWAADSHSAADYIGQTSPQAASINISFQHQVRDREYTAFTESWGSLVFHLDTAAELSISSFYDYFVTGNESFARLTLNVDRFLTGTPLTIPIWSGGDFVYSNNVDTIGQIAFNNVMLLPPGETYRIEYSAGLVTSNFPPPTMRMLEGTGQLILQLREVPEPGVAIVLPVLTWRLIKRCSRKRSIEGHY